MKRSHFALGGGGATLVACSKRSKALARVLGDSALPLPQRLVRAFDVTFDGPHAGFRANHAKGFVCSGTFTPAAAARALSQARHFHVPGEALVRLSNFGGYPTIPDNLDGASPYGMAVKFEPLFPTATPEAFVGFLQALGCGGPALQAYLHAHPKALEFVRSLRAGPVSYATLSYHFINAFRLVDGSGGKHAVRYEMRAREPIAFLDRAVAEARPPAYLYHEMRERLARRAVVFDYIAHVAAPGDVTSDPTAYWPAERRQVRLGTLIVRSLVASGYDVQRKTLFDPARIVPGIELSDDPMVAVRSQSYAISFSRRSA